MRRVITRFDDENYSWLDPDLSGPPDSTLNQIYDDQWGLLRNAEQALAGARAEHADRGGENALDGSQLSRILPSPFMDSVSQRGSLLKKPNQLSCDV